MTDGSSIETNATEVLLGIAIDKYVNSLGNKKRGKSLMLLPGTIHELWKKNDNHESIHRVSVYKPSFNLVWMFHNRVINDEVNRIHERALRITCNNKSSSFQDLLDKDNSVTVHHRNTGTLAVEKIQSFIWAFPTSFKL